MNIACSSCGGAITRPGRTGLCRPCYWKASKRNKPRHCITCGVGIHQYSVGNHCRPCHHKSRTVPIPADFAERAATMSASNLARHYAVSNNLVGRWIRDSGVRPVRRDAIPVAADYVDLAPTMGVNQLQAHFGVEYQVIRRWARITGVEPLKVKRKPPPRPKPKHGGRISYGQPPIPAFQGINFRDDSVEGRAADHLRCSTRAVIYRCNERGAVPADKSKATHWRYGNVVLTADELIARAERYGFQLRIAA